MISLGPFTRVVMEFSQIVLVDVCAVIPAKRMNFKLDQALAFLITTMNLIKLAQHLSNLVKFNQH